jgi:hypothetical protein
MFQKLESFTQKVSDLADKPSLNPTELKAQFDAAPDEVRVYLNNLIDALKLTTAGDSGAKNIGVTTISGVTGNDIQTLLEKAVFIVEQGSNGNGTYRKYSDGTMECWKYEEYNPTSPAAWATLSVAGSTYYYIPGTWTYPTPFLSGSKVICSMSGDINGVQPETHKAHHTDHTQCGVESGSFGVDTRGFIMKRQLYARGVWK